MITEYTPKTSDTEESTSALDLYCEECEKTIMRYRDWSLAGVREHVGRFMHLIPSWISEGVTVEDTVARMIGGNPAIGYR